ncbi:MAG: hypothetical protein KAR24_01185 [Candidatus Pacebacteria bacterium]|nr:hypothetical protein [Candidatus Paceibacterota bacterium]
MIFMLAEAYEKEECGRIFSQLQDKQKDPSLYPGFHLTPHIKSMCPEIEHQLQ